MLDYTLVSTRATYRMLQQSDIAAFLALVTRCHAAGPHSLPTPQECILATFRELQRNKDRGTLFVFEREQALVGYSILVTTWSNRLGGIVLSIDELHIDPRLPDTDLAADFLTLIAKVAPTEVCTIQVHVDAKDRRARDACRKIGFKDAGQAVLLMKPVRD